MSVYAFDCYVCGASVHTNDIQELIAFCANHKECA